MNRLLLLGAAVASLLAAAAFSRPEKKPEPAPSLRIESQKQNPWTHLRLNNDPRSFRFAIVSDRTGSHRPLIFSRAVEQLNLLQPEFVLSVGDLIEGGTEDKDKLATQWREFDGYVKKLQMPFFYVPGNHDVSNAVQVQYWNDRFGRSYYHFVYRDVLFLMLNSDDPPKKGGIISDKQIAYVKKTLEDNAKVCWTIVALHKPLWTHSNVEKNGWLEVEKLLNGRNYTVFVGHVHRYQKFIRQGMNYYQLATTGGGSKLRGVRYGEFDHIAWVTMKRDGPHLANVLLDGVLQEDLGLPASTEKGVSTRNRKKVYPVSGKVTFAGKPLSDALVTFYLIDPLTEKLTRAADALTETDGSYRLSTYKAHDGAPEGKFKVTVVQRVPLFDKDGKPGPDRLKDKYAPAAKTPLTAEVGKEAKVMDWLLEK